MVEWIGILASCFVLISFTLKGEKRIRLVNIIGAVLFVIYGALIKSLSVWLLNGILIGVHIYYLIKDFKHNKEKENKNER